MGASESTAKTNGTGDDEENSQQESRGSSMGGGKAAMALAAAGAAAAAFAAWDNPKGTGDDEEEGRRESGGSYKALAAAGVAGVAALGISRMLSENTDSQQKHGYHGTGSFSGHTFSGIGERTPRTFRILTDGRCHSVDGESYECPQVVPEDGVERRESGYGGTLRDHQGKWVCSFRGYIGKTDCFTAELHGIHEGLKLVEKFRHKGAILENDYTILESDCKAAVDWINDIEKDPSTNKSKIVLDSSDIIKKCRVLARNNNTTVKHIRGKDANQCAHKLADLAILKKDKDVLYEHLSQLPDEIKHHIC